MTTIRSGTRPIKWVAELAHVREVSLRGTADFGFWQDRLMAEELVPAITTGRAQIWIAAADAKFKGIRFRELSVSVRLAGVEEPPAQDAYFLAGAFNSRWLFALSERVLFSTPYRHANVRLSATCPTLTEVSRRGEVVFRAEMAAGNGPDREPSQCGPDGWEGAIFLPGSGRARGRSHRVFFARLRGETQTYPFLPAQDLLMIRPSQGADPLQALVESQFAPREWVIRTDAVHAKSKTYTRAAALIQHSAAAMQA